MSMISRHYVRSLIGQHIHCHTHYGTFHGVVVHCTKHHLILVPAYAVSAPTHAENSVDDARWGPGGYGSGPGPGGYGPGGGGGGGWHIAIPLAAIIGVTALGMHWW